MAILATKIFGLLYYINNQAKCVTTSLDSHIINYESFTITISIVFIMAKEFLQNSATLINIYKYFITFTPAISCIY